MYLKTRLTRFNISSMSIYVTPESLTTVTWAIIGIVTIWYLALKNGEYSFLVKGLYLIIAIGAGAIVGGISSAVYTILNITLSGFFGSIFISAAFFAIIGMIIVDLFYNSAKDKTLINRLQTLLKFGFVGGWTVGIIISLAIFPIISLVGAPLFYLPTTFITNKWGQIEAFVFWFLWILGCESLKKRGNRLEREAQNPLRGLLVQQPLAEVKKRGFVRLLFMVKNRFNAS